MSMIPVRERIKQEDCRFQAKLSYTARPLFKRSKKQKGGRTGSENGRREEKDEEEKERRGTGEEVKEKEEGKLSRMENMLYFSGSQPSRCCNPFIQFLMLC